SIAERLTKQRDIRDQREPNNVSAGGAEIERTIQKRSQTENEDIERQADDKLVRGQPVTQVGVDNGNAQAPERAHGKTHEARSNPLVADDRSKRPGKQHPLDGNIQGPSAFGDPFTTGREDEQHR
ncbi:MAG: hypothetical protein ACJAZD_002607, partial [Ilumatobacter sp.]